VLFQRWLLKSASKYISLKGKATRQKLLPLGGWKWVALAIVALWLVFTIVVPISGVVLRSVVEQWGEGINLSEVLTLANYRQVFDQSDEVRAIINTLMIGVVGGGIAVACYTAIGLAGHRRADGVSRFLDYIVLVPRAIPGLLAGLAFLWIFLFVPGLAELRNTIFSVWLAYTVVWLAYGLRLISSALLQIGPELEESARTVGAPPARVLRDVTIPLIRFGLLASWLLVFMIFEREYSTGVYLLGQGTEVIGSMLVSLWGAGAIDQVAALSVINIALVAVGLAVALRFGVRLHE
jgi:iron(III) transport system permease protein